MNKAFPRLRARGEHEHLLASDALIICFFMKHSCQQVAPCVVRCIETLRERLLPMRFDEFITHDGYYRPLTGSYWEEVQQALLSPDDPMTTMLLTDERGGAGSLFIHYRGLILPCPWPERQGETGLLYLRVPTEYLEERGPTHLRELAVELAHLLPFNSGYVNLSLCGSISDPPDDLVDLVQRRYWGIHLAGQHGNLEMDTKVDGVHWLNFLGQPVLGELGGVSGLRERLGNLPGLSLQELDGERVLIALGEAPTAGDREAGEALPLHRALARVLEPYLYQHQRFVGIEEREAHRRWERRFLE